MILLNTPCAECRYYLGKINSWRTGCKAFPNGFPIGFLGKIDVKKLKECANGYKWEPREDK